VVKAAANIDEPGPLFEQRFSLDRGKLLHAVGWAALFDAYWRLRLCGGCHDALFAVAVP
jgi:hypothetical protein